MAVALNKKANSFANNPLFRGMGKIIDDVSKETSRIRKNVIDTTKKAINNVVQGTKKVATDVTKEAIKIAKNVEKETSDIKKEAEKVVKDVADGMGNTVNSVVKGANNVLGYIKDSVKRDHEMLKNEAKIEEVNKILDGQEKSQKKKSFSEGISGMELGEDTISNRVAMSDSSDRESIYNNFKLEKDFKKGKIFSYGKEEFEILDIVKTKSGMKAVVLGNKNTKGVEIIYEGSTAPTEILKKGGQVLQDWNNNGGGNMRRSRLDLMTGGLSEIVKSPVEGTLKFALRGMYESNENGTPLHYQEALELAKRVQNEYKDGKGGYNKGLTRVSGHSKGGGEAIYTASHLNIEAIATDPAPVNNPGKYLYNNKIIRVVPNNGSGLLNIKPSKAILELSTKVSPYSSKTLSKDKISDEIDKITKNHKTYSVGALVGKQRMDNLPTLEVKAHKEDGLHHKTDYESVLAKEKEVLNNLKNYKASQNRGR